MKKIWAPWRLEYLKENKKSERKGGKKSCPFCELPKKGVNADTLILFQNKQLMVIMNKFPYNPGHLMVIPRQHVGMPHKVTPALWSLLASAVQACMQILQKSMQPQGFNVGMNVGAAGGAGIAAHLHWHIIPRWNGDTNFMPAIFETKAIPAHNATVYRQLKSFFTHFSAALTSDKIKI